MSVFTFNFTGATQNFLIPNGVSKATIKVWGGGGGGQVNIASTSSVAGAGGYSYGEINLTPGQTLSIVVARGGLFNSSAFNSGSFQGGGTGGLGQGGSGGGGFSSVSFQGQGPFILAGGGGGSGVGNISANLFFGGNGGGASGNDAVLTSLNPPSSVSAKGGTQSAGGVGGSYSGNPATAGFNGTAFRGGRGGTEGSGLNGGGGGGGGGFFGGGGGAGTNEIGVPTQQEQPGGGGSGFIDTAVLQNAFTEAAPRVTTKTVALPPNTTDPNYIAGIGVGPITDVAGGNGLVVIEFLPSALFTKRADKSFAKIGDVINYTLVVTTNPNTATNVIFLDTIPSNTTFNSNSLVVDGVTLTGANPNPPGVNIGTLGTSSNTITFSVTVTTLPNSNVVTNFGSIFGTGLDIATSNTVTTTIVSAILNSTKQVSKTAANVGDILTYTIPITNTGNITATSIIFIDTVPNGTTIIPNSLRQDGVTVSGSSNPPGVTLPNPLGVNRTTTITFQVVITTVPNPNPIPNTATAIGTYIVDSTTTPNRAATAITNTNTVNTAVNFASLSGITKFVDKSFATCGEIITYTIVAPNSGNVTALNVVFKDTIPNGTSLVINSVFVNGSQQSGGNPATGVTIPNIAPGSTATVTFSVQVQC